MQWEQSTGGLRDFKTKNIQIMTNFLIFLIYEIQWELSTGGLKDFKIKNIQIMEADFS